MEIMSGKTDCCGIRSPAHYINEEDGFTYLERRATGNYVMF